METPSQATQATPATPYIPGTSISTLPDNRGAVAFVRDFSLVFREQGEITPVEICPGHRYIPWGIDNQMPFSILDLFDRDETMSACHLFNTEVCYGAGLQYAPPCPEEKLPRKIQSQILEFYDASDIPAYFLGICGDIKMFAFAVSVIDISPDGRKITTISRREACYCRFAEADRHGNIPFVYYANWRLASVPEEIECIPLLPQKAQLRALADQIKKGRRKLAVLHRIPTVDYSYYPIPYYASLIRGKWYNIKQLIGTAKEATLRNSAPLKYHIEIADSYWERIWQSEHITDRLQQIRRVDQEKANIIDFITGAENAGKVLFSSYYITPDRREQHDVLINKIDTDRQGGDWATDLQEAVNMICFTMRVHSNLVGSVPGKAQTNNSGSDKRELYTISQATQKPWRDVLFTVHRLIIAHNGWAPAIPQCPFMQLTTLDEHTSAKKVTT